LDFETIKILDDQLSNLQARTTQLLGKNNFKKMNNDFLLPAPTPKKIGLESQANVEFSSLENEK